MKCFQTEDCGGMVWSSEDLQCVHLLNVIDIDSHMVEGPGMTEVQLELSTQCIFRTKIVMVKKQIQS